VHPVECEPVVCSSILMLAVNLPAVVREWRTHRRAQQRRAHKYDHEAPAPWLTPSG